jgi:hypothetical protein
MSDTLTEPQMRALAAMPVRLTAAGFLPHGAPHANLIRRLRDKGLVERTESAWVRTALGDAAMTEPERSA